MRNSGNNPETLEVLTSTSIESFYISLYFDISRVEMIGNVGLVHPP